MSSELEHEAWWAATHPPGVFSWTACWRPNTATEWAKTQERHYRLIAAKPGDVYHTNAIIVQPPHAGRGTKAAFAGSTCVWADIDYGASHQRTQVLSGLTETLEVVNLSPVEPTLVVHSGAGVHLYWCFDVIVDPVEVETLNHKLQSALRHIAGGRGVDFVHDIGRVLRTPGSVHRNGTPVTVLEEGPRHERGTVEATVDEWFRTRRLKWQPPGASAALSAHVGAPDVDAGRQLLELLCEDGWDDKLIALWVHNNRGWMKDQSDSGPTMCVARIVFSYLADAQKAVNAAAAWRVKWARDPRLERLDLWRRIAGELENTCTDVN